LLSAQPTHSKDTIKQAAFFPALNAVFRGEESTWWWIFKTNWKAKIFRQMHFLNGYPKLTFELSCVWGKEFSFSLVFKSLRIKQCD
jgi:hypothetical protein